MDFLNHASHGYLMTKILNCPEYINISSAFIGAAPDLIGFSEKVFYYLKGENWAEASQRWNWYNFVHKKLKYLRVLPEWGFHILLDLFTHGSGKEWWKWNERLWMEVLSWIIVLLIFYLKFYG